MIEYRIKQTKAGYTIQIYNEDLHLHTFRYKSPLEIADLFVEGARVVVFRGNSAPRIKELEQLIRKIQRTGYKITIKDK